MKFQDREAKQKGGRSTSPAKAAAARRNAREAAARQAVSRFPVLQRPGWSAEEILAACRPLKRLPPTEHSGLSALLDGVLPYKALAMLETLGRLPTTERAAIYAQAGSADEHERGKAIARALGLPPPLDPAVPAVQRARDELRRAAGLTREPDLREQLFGHVDTVRATLNRLIERTGGHPL